MTNSKRFRPSTDSVFKRIRDLQIERDNLRQLADKTKNLIEKNNLIRVIQHYDERLKEEKIFVQPILKSLDSESRDFAENYYLNANQEVVYGYTKSECDRIRKKISQACLASYKNGSIFEP